MSSRKSSASSTSSHGNSKLKPIQSSNSSKGALSSNSSTFINKKHETDEIPKKISYLENFTEEDIEKDKVKKRYEILMKKLEGLTIEQNNLKENKNINGHSASSLPSTSSKKVLPKISKKAENANSNLNAVNEAKGSQSSSSNNKSMLPKPISKGPVVSSSSSDDESDKDLPTNHIKAPNELLEEFLVYVMGKKWKDAQKLCQFILMYEPENKTAKEFMPLIESKLNSSESGEEDGEESSEETSSDESTSDSNSNDDESNDTSDEDEEKDIKEIAQKPKDDYDDDDDVETPSSARLSKKKQEPFVFGVKK